MTFEEYRKHDALGLAELVRNKAVSPKELLDLAVARAEAVNPKINAIIHPLYDYAAAMIDKIPANAPFAGVPTVIKDLALHVENTPLESGTRAAKGFISKKDGEYVKRYRSAGLLFMGKSNTPEFGLTPWTEPQSYGPSRNPWNQAYTTGGSSGGSAASVAAGIVPIATAADGGGSIRIPAACCGLVGLKPSRGRIPLGDFTLDAWSGAVVEGCVSRTVRDTAAFMDAMQGPMAGSHYRFPQSTSFMDAIAQAPRKLRIGFSTQHPLDHKIDPENAAAIQKTLQVLQSLGHEVEEVPLPINRENLLRDFMIMVFAETSAMVREIKAEFPNFDTRKMEYNTQVSANMGKYYNGQEVSFRRRNWNKLAYQMGVFHQKYDLLLTPVLGQHPIKIGDLGNSPTEDRLLSLVLSLGLDRFVPQSMIDKLGDKSLGYIPYPPLANMTGQPAISLPMHWSAAGVPVGVMFTAPFADEQTLLQLAQQLQDVERWQDKLAQL
jgi:amidase